jgi:hypothetical protein
MNIVWGSILSRVVFWAERSFSHDAHTRYHVACNAAIFYRDTALRHAVMARGRIVMQGESCNPKRESGSIRDKAWLGILESFSGLPA